MLIVAFHLLGWAGEGKGYGGSTVIVRIWGEVSYHELSLVHFVYLAEEIECSGGISFESVVGHRDLLSTATR